MLNRQRLMTVALSVFLSLAANAACSSAVAADRPNIIWIMADDLGYGELGCYGQEVILTPRIDEMARQGLRFTQFYAGATVCAPSRSVLNTGKHHGRTTVRGNAGRTNPTAQSLQPDDVTVASMLQGAGYKTGLVGKWGLGDVGEAEMGLPNKQGFDHFFGFLNQHRAHNHFTEYLWKNQQKLLLPNEVTPVGEFGGGYANYGNFYADDLFTDDALKFVANSQDQPFFLYWSMVVPHANNERNRALKDGAHTPDYGPYALRDWPPQDKGQAAMITRMDSYVGRMLDHLKLLGLDKNTLVIFTSDNGPHNESNHDLARFKPSGPFTGIKRSLTEGGIRVPGIAWWPGTIAAGTVSDHPAYFGDLMATAAELSGALPPDDIDSISFVPTLKGKPESQQRHEFIYWEFHEGGFKQAALYQGRWKGHRRGGPKEPIQLYDLATDPAEKNNVADDYPDVANTVSEYLMTARTENSNWVPNWGNDKKK